MKKRECDELDLIQVFVGWERLCEMVVDHL